MKRNFNIKVLPNLQLRVFLDRIITAVQNIEVYNNQLFLETFLFYKIVLKNDLKIFFYTVGYTTNLKFILHYACT